MPAACPPARLCAAAAAVQRQATAAASCAPRVPPPACSSRIRRRCCPAPCASASKRRGGGGEQAGSSNEATPHADDAGGTALGLFTGSPNALDHLCAGFCWPAALGRLPPGPPEAWTPESRTALLGSFVRLWPCVRARICAGTVRQAADAELRRGDGGEGAEAAADVLSAPHVRHPAGDTRFMPLTWADVEAVGVVACAAAGLRAGGVEARVAVDALFSILVSQNIGLAERLMIDSGVEEAIYASLVRAGVHRTLCGLITQPLRFLHPLHGGARTERAALRSYLGAKLAGAERARALSGEWLEADGLGGVLHGDDNAAMSAATFDCLFLLHMCTNWRTGYASLRPHNVEALSTMALTAEEAEEARTAWAMEYSTLRLPDAVSKRKLKRTLKRAEREARLQMAQLEVQLRRLHPSNAYVSMLLECLGVDPTGLRQAADAAADGTQALLPPTLPSDSWRLRQRGVAELVSVAVRNGELVRRLAEDPLCIPTLVGMACSPLSSVRVQAQAAATLYHVAGADVRSIYGLASEAEAPPLPGALEGTDADVDVSSTDALTSLVPTSGSSAATQEIDLDDMFDGRVGPESAAFLLGVFDSQWHARRGDPSLVRARLEAALKGGGSRATASLLMAAGAERALVTLVKERTAGTAHARMARGYAAAALTVLSRIDECRPALVAAGAIPPLIAMLDETDCALDFSAPARDVLLSAALPHDPAPMSFDGSWLLNPGKPLLAEIAAAALLGLAGRASLFSAASAPYEGGPSFAEAMLRGVASNFGSFGAPDEEARAGDETRARAVGARRRVHARLLNVLTIDYETANIIADEGAIAPLVALLGRGSELARQTLAALAVSPDIFQRIIDLGGEGALRNSDDDADD